MVNRNSELQEGKQNMENNKYVDNYKILFCKNSFNIHITKAKIKT